MARSSRAAFTPRDAAGAGGRGEAVEDVAAAGIEAAPERAEEPSADRVDDDVGAAIEVAGEELARGVVEAGVHGAELAAEGELGFGADEGESLRASQRNQLQERGPDAAGRRRDDDAVAGADLRAGERVPGRQEDDRHRGGLDEIHAVEKREDPLRRHGDFLGVAAEERDGDDSLPGAKIGDILADAFDRARDLHARHERRLRCPRIHARAHEEVGEIQADRRRLDENFAAAGNRIGTLPQDEALGPAVPVYEPRAGTASHGSDYQRLLAAREEGGSIWTIRFTVDL